MYNSQKVEIIDLSILVFTPPPLHLFEGGYYWLLPPPPQKLVTPPPLKKSAHVVIPPPPKLCEVLPKPLKPAGNPDWLFIGM